MISEPKPTIFEFTSYQFDPEKKRVFLNYKQDFNGRESILFTETIILPDYFDETKVSDKLLKKLLEGLHLVSGVSYYKFYCATKFKTSYELSKKEADFWNIIYRDGLGEFYFRNKLDPKKSPKFPFNKNKKDKIFDLIKNNKCLVALSGGKDSFVACELLKEQGVDITTIFTETNVNSVLVDDVAKEVGVNFLKIQRILDKQVFEKHKYNGHIPISAIYAFLGVLCSALYGFSYFVVSNEFSSNFGNIKYKGKVINHQWSKSSEFENLFSDYLNNFISTDLKYFSLIRPFYEIRIAEIFSSCKKYFSNFSSCNKNFKLIDGNLNNEPHGLWCGECPKCVFVFTLMSAFLTKDELIGIFKKNLYQNENLLSLFEDILGLGKMKPFDCVGTFEESKAAFVLSSQKFKDDFIVRKILPKVKQQDASELFKTQDGSNIPTQFKFSGMKNVLILGYGKEGQVSKKYIEKEFPNLKIEVADEATDGKQYLQKQSGFDLAIKTAGMPKELVKIPYTTATNIFFSKIKLSGNTVIGITGSKGKSTTASLIYSILKEAGKNVKLLGNIGSPMLEEILSPINKEVIYVIELSSYQLDDIEFSPDIAVVTNLFPEHMNYHGSERNYYEAKRNIVKFQNKNDIFICDSKNKIISFWLKNIKSKVLDFAKEDFLYGVKLNLIGEHNKKNTLAAIMAAKKIGIADETIKHAIEKFQPLPHRLQLVGKFNEIEFYDDAISTSPESTIEAIKSLKNIDTILLGGEDRGYNFSDLEKTIKKYKIRNVVLFPESGKRIKLKGLNILNTKSMEEAVEFAYQNTEKGKICLLSCASPSYSLWKDFEEKGDQFQLFVKKISLHNERTI